MFKSISKEEIVMPLITVTYASNHQKLASKAQIAAEVTRLSSTILRKAPEVTALIVQRVEPEDWFAGGRSLADAGLASFWLDIHITEGTNTKDEKAKFLAETFKSMGKLLGPLHEESYAHVHEVRGDAYGFGGLTQERRYIASTLAVPPAAAAA
jgi:4-oxalocrotonate tautomerase